MILLAPRRLTTRFLIGILCLFALQPLDTLAQGSLLDAVQARLAQHPDETHLHYYAAMLHARQQRWDAAAEELDKLIDADWRGGIEPAQFAGYAQHRDVATKLATLQSRADRGTNSRLTFSLGERDLIPEGIAFDTKTDSFLLGSIHQGKIVRVTRTGEVSDLVAARAGGLDQVLGIKADAARRVLWAASVSAAGDATAIVRFHLDTGELLGRHELRAADRPVGFNDLCLEKGRAFATETAGGAVYEIVPQDPAPRLLIPPGQLRGPNGIACAGDTLWVSDTLTLRAIDVRTATMREIASLGAASGAGIDGLAIDGNRLIGIQNSFARGRVVELVPDLDNARIVAARVLEPTHVAFGIPTTGVVVDGAFHFIANSQFDLRSDDGTLPSADKLRDVLILNVPLSRE